MLISAISRSLLSPYGVNRRYPWCSALSANPGSVTFAHFPLRSPCRFRWYDFSSRCPTNRVSSSIWFQSSFWPDAFFRSCSAGAIAIHPCPRAVSQCTDSRRRIHRHFPDSPLASRTILFYRALAKAHTHYFGNGNADKHATFAYLS